MTSHCFTIGELSGLITPRVREVVDALKVFGPGEATNNIWGWRWSKLLINCMMNALSGIIGDAVFSLNEEQQDTANLIRVVTGCEVARVATTLGITLEPIIGIPGGDFAEVTTTDGIMKLKVKLEAAMKRRYIPPEKTKKLGAPDRPSLLQDVIKGRRTEVDYLNGEAVKKGNEVGISTPMNRAIVDLTKKIEDGEVKPDPQNLERLKPYLII